MDKDRRFNEKGLEYFRAKQYEKALENFNEAIRLKNDNADYYRNRAYCYYEMKQFEAGDRDFGEASKIQEIVTAICRIDDRFTSSEDFRQYLQTLEKYKNDARFAEKIAQILSVYITRK